jgi:hypothetical protein
VERKHPDELFVEELEEAFQNDLEQLSDFLLTNGRPIFFKKLSSAEELAMYMNPDTRIQMLEDKLKDEGPKGMLSFKERMQRSMASYQASMNPQGVA